MSERLRVAREKLYESAAEAARALGVNYNTYVAHENGSRGFGRSAAIKYSAKFNVSLEYLLTGRTVLHTRELPKGIVSATGAGLIVKGFVRAGIWQETYKPETETVLPISMDMRYAGREQFALEIQGDSMNRRFKAGEFAVCVKWDDDPRDNDVVIVERNKNGLFESTVKIIKVISPSRVELWPDSTDPDYQEPFILQKNEQEDGEEISIVAKVIGIYRKV